MRDEKDKDKEEGEEGGREEEGLRVDRQREWCEQA